MLIEEDIYWIYGNAEDPAEERPLNVFSNRDDEDVIVGDSQRNRRFFIKNHGPNAFSFQLEDFNLYIGFDSDQATNILKLAREEVIWNVSDLKDNTIFEVYLNDGSRNFYWDMNSDVFSSTIRLSSGLAAPRPPQQKWKFVRVVIGD